MTSKCRLPQAYDFLKESESLYTLVEGLSDDELYQETQFKDWTLNDVIGHLHVWNWAANESLVDEDSFLRFSESLFKDIGVYGSLRQFEEAWLDGLCGKRLVNHWKKFLYNMSARFADCDPKQRLKWVGPDMSARSSITARLMETWAHGQEIFDHLGIIRKDEDRIRNIVILGTNTFNWTFIVRQEEVPGPMPFVKLFGPSGDAWEFGEINSSNYISGSATEFCQVVTQVRNIADTKLTVIGPIALEWMSKAQCFAGAAEVPPPAGSRYTRRL